VRAGVLKPDLAEIKPDDVPRWPDKSAPAPVPADQKKAEAKSSTD
jgi:hypothetical protein